MKRSLVGFFLLLGLLLGLAAPAQAQRGRHYRGRGYYARPVPRRYYRAPAYRPHYGPRYYHAAPYRSYGNRYYYRPRPYYRQPGPAIIIRP
ncbi:MAG: hypothetical protein EOO62_34620 [Hymenobacter sp.]|nr:MAG: hypothetical protein EOO62_34620 [Hymenobacter sp.]